MAFESRPFQPAAWASGPHAQTLLGRFLRPSVGPEYQRERIETPDGDFLDLDWAPEVDHSGPIALILHGLEGSSDRGNVRNVCRALMAAVQRAIRDPLDEMVVIETIAEVGCAAARIIALAAVGRGARERASQMREELAQNRLRQALERQREEIEKLEAALE